MAELMRLRQKKSVCEYYKEFDSIVNRLNLSEEYMLSCFLGGLKNEIQMLVHMVQPSTIRRAFTLARMYEVANSPSTQTTLVTKPHKGILGSKPAFTVKPMASTMSSSLGSNAGNGTKVKSNKSLTPAYMSERRAKGLCYFCDEPYSQEHSLTHKKLQVHVLEVEEEEEELVESANLVINFIADSDQGSPQISINALTSVANFRTMRITWY
uniref:Retrotransposon gag domain-containing protein n=1 Tax=Cajanus cajan TaxID=3821 RepID=A0A151T8W7_CAJCA|nr:hypothetical protein KK1_018013 [Cajanus cajan]